MRKSGRGSATRGWKKQKPSARERTTMLQQCGQKCFLGPNKSFPICTKKTCKINRRGVQSAYIRARQWKHNTIANKAKLMLKRMLKRMTSKRSN